MGGVSRCRERAALNCPLDSPADAGVAGSLEGRVAISLNARIAALLDAQGALVSGVADLTGADIHEEVVAQGGEWLGAFPRAVSIGYRLQDGIVDELPERHREAVVARLYDFHVYRTVNDLLDETAYRVAAELQRAGFLAVAVPTSLPVDTTGFKGALSHKLVARAAGLGWIGRSCLLISPSVGPRIRLVSVLTTAPLQAGNPSTRDCGRCRLCVDYCPAHAFTGEAFRLGNPLEERMDVHACHEYRQAAKEASGVTICGVCVAVCPHGRTGRQEAAEHRSLGPQNALGGAI